MKKYLIFSILSLIFLSSLSARAVKKVEANPINVAVMLIQEKDTTKMASTLDYYGYTPDTSTLRHLIPESPLTPDTYKVFTHPNGSSIRYKYTDSNKKFPTVEVTSKASVKEKDQVLQNLNFTKNGNEYEQKSVGFITCCTFGPHGILILTRHSKPKD